MQDVCFYRETELNLEYNFRLSVRQTTDNYLYKTTFHGQTIAK